MNTTEQPIVGVDLGGTNMQVGVVAGGPDLLAQVKEKTRARDGAEAVVERIAGAVRDACAKAGVAMQDLAGVGLAAAGAIDHTHGVVIEAPNLGWRGFPLGEAMRAALGVPIAVENDVNAALVGEHRYGAGRGRDELLGVWVGTGVGGALILAGELYYGAVGTAGEFGHMTLLPDAATGRRTVEDNCSRTAVVRELKRRADRGEAPLLLELSDGDVGSIRSRIIAEAHQRGDTATRDVVQQAAHGLGVAIASVATLMSFDRVVLGGGLTEAIGEPLVDMVQASARRLVFPEALAELEVVMTELEERAGILGAAIVARERLAADRAG